MGSRRDFVRAGVLTAGAVAVGGLGLRGAEASGLRVTQHKWLSHRLLDLTVYSPAMGCTVHNRLLVPPGWSATAKRTWPVLYLLHGGNDTYVSWTRSTDIEKFTANKDMLVVMPEGGMGGGYTDWWFGGKGGSPRWETYHLPELSRVPEQHYRGSRTRAVVGPSAGGDRRVGLSRRPPAGLHADAGCPGVGDHRACLQGVQRLRHVGEPLEWAGCLEGPRPHHPGARAARQPPVCLLRHHRARRSLRPEGHRLRRRHHT